MEPARCPPISAANRFLFPDAVCSYANVHAAPDAGAAHGRDDRDNSPINRLSIAGVARSCGRGGADGGARAGGFGDTCTVVVPCPRAIGVDFAFFNKACALRVFSDILRKNRQFVLICDALLMETRLPNLPTMAGSMGETGRGGFHFAD